MPWTEVHKVDLRQELIYRYLNQEKITDLCREYQISRKTAYKFIRRFEQHGPAGLEDLSRRPHRLAQKTDALVERLIVDAKLRYPTWGAKKLKPRLEALYPSIRFPALSTISAILARQGLVRFLPRRLSRSAPPSRLRSSEEPNQIWCLDFKGQFQTKDRRCCYPLTATDHYSRSLLACESLPVPSSEQVVPVLEDCFRAFGLPEVIRTDNGPPFASATAPYGLTKLSVWLIKCGITLERIEPGHPEQNGRHERMHRTLKAEACHPPAAHLLQQQEYFDAFRRIYNQERPHEALGQVTPASRYRPSDRQYQEPVPDCEYPQHTLSRRVDSTGRIHLTNGRTVRISKALDGERLGFKEYDQHWLVTFSCYDIGIIPKDSLIFESMEHLDG